MLRSLSAGEIVMILLVVLIVFGVFGAKRLPEASRSVGRSLRIFKSEIKEMRRDDEANARDGSSARSDSATPELEGRLTQTRDDATARLGDIRREH